MFVRLKREVRLLLENKLRFIFTASLLIFCAVVTWLDADSMSFVRKLFVFPGYTLPLWMLFIIWTVSFFLISVIASSCSDVKGGFVMILAVTVFLLFWCPLLFSAAAGILSCVSALLSLVCTVTATAVLCRRSVLGILSGTFLSLNITYFFLISLGFTVMN